MKESKLEARLVRLVRQAGGLTYKFVSPGHTGVPDRIVITPGGRVWFLELKTERGRLSPRQVYQLERLRQVGANALAVYGPEDLERVLHTIFLEDKQDEVSTTQLSAIRH